MKNLATSKHKQKSQSPKGKRTFLYSGRVLFALVVLLALLVRLPYLTNPERMNSDHAFLGLQALRILKGEWSLFLWGSEYQASLEPLLAAILFSIFGASFRVLQWVPLLGFLTCLAITFRVLLSYSDKKIATLLTLVLAVATQPFISINVLPYRQWSIVFGLLPLWLVLRKKKWAFFCAGFSGFFALFVDFFTIQFVVPIAFLVPKKRPVVFGAITGGCLLILSRLFTERGAPLAFSFKTMFSNIPLFFKTCLPVFAGVPYPIDAHGTAIPVGIVPLLSVLLLSLLLIATVSGIRFAQPSHKPIAQFGGLLCACSVLGFWGSSMASDAHAVRYLSPMIYAAPFGCLPWIIKFPKSFKLFLFFYLVLTGIASWRQAAPMTQGVRIVRDPGAWVETARELKTWIKMEGVSGGYAEYWRAYQLAFLFNEDPLIIPRNYPDRYDIYRRKVVAFDRVVEIFTPEDPPSDAEFAEKYLRSTGTYEAKWAGNGFTAFIRRK